MVTLKDVQMSFAGRLLFAGVSLQINRGDRLALVGANGVGKSTLVAIIRGELTPDAGLVACEKGLVRGFLPQETAPTADETALELATAISPAVADLRRRIHAHEAAAAAGDRGGTTADEAYHRALEDLAASGAREAEPEAKKVLAGLGFPEADCGRPLRELSGGWQMRAHLARLLVMKPDLLLLDEPTNHLDLESVLWLQDYLCTQRATLLTISHDREFIDAVTDQIYEIRHRRLHRYRGDFALYLAERAARDDRHRAAYDNQRKQIQQTMASVNRFRAKARRASQAQSKLKELDRMEKVLPPDEDSPPVRFRFPQPSRAGLHPVVLRGIHQAYGGRPVYRGIDFECLRGEKVVLVGPNGAGKSTLLKILAGLVPVQAGERSLGNNARIGYYAQNRLEMLDPGRTVLGEALAARQPQPEEFTRTVLGCFLFRGDDVFKSVAVLSGGEKSRLALAKQLLDPPNVLLMDEPTTHLDLASTEALIAALRQFEGTLIFISHDVYFIRSLATRVVRIVDGQLAAYPGGFDYYAEKTGIAAGKSGIVAAGPPPTPPAAAAGAGRPAAGAAALRAADRPPSPPPAGARFKTKEQKRREAEERQARSAARQRWQRQVDGCEAEILAAEQRRAEVLRLLENPEVYQRGGEAVELNRELLGLETTLERLNAEWAAAAEELARYNERPDRPDDPGRVAAAPLAKRG